MNKNLRTLVLVIFLAGCNLPKANQTPPQDEVATRVSVLLTQASTQTPTLALQTELTATETPVPIFSPTATSTLEAIPTSPPNTPTPPPDDPRQALGNPTWSDSFDSGRNFFITDDQVRFKSDLENGHFVLTSYRPDGWHSWSLSYPRINNFYIETTATPRSCSGLDRYGMILRVPDPTQGYLFGLSCDGRFSFRRWNGSEFTNLVNWTPHTSIVGGSNQTNRLGVLADGSRFSLYLNGVLVGEAEDASYLAGTFGLFSAATETENFTVQFEEIAYWTLP